MALPSPLSGFSRVNETVYFYQPSKQERAEENTVRSANAPDIILLLSWAGAPVKAAAKYTAHYQTAYPSSSIVLVTTSFRDVLLHTETAQQKPLAPVLQFMADKPDAKILVHLFSNGGSYKLVELAKAYRRAHGSVLPVQAIAFDSAPGRAEFGSAGRAMAAGLPKPWYLYYLGRAVIFLYLVLLTTYTEVTRGEILITRMWRALNDTSLITTKARRLYIFSEADQMVNAEDIVIHGRSAQKQGYDVELQEFPGSKHVTHMMMDSARYWSLVSKLWGEAVLQYKP